MAIVCLVLMDVEELTQINFAAKFQQHRLTTDTEGDIATVNLTFYKFPWQIGRFLSNGFGNEMVETYRSHAS